MPVLGRAPNQRTFFSMLQEAGANAESATHKLDRLMRTWPDEQELRAEVKVLEGSRPRWSRPWS